MIFSTEGALIIIKMNSRFGISEFDNTIDFTSGGKTFFTFALRVLSASINLVVFRMIIFTELFSVFHW